MVRSTTIDLLDVCVVQHRVVDYQLQEIRGRGYAGEFAELKVGRTRPADDDDERDKDRAERVEPPGDLGTGRRGEDTEAVRVMNRKWNQQVNPECIHILRTHPLMPKSLR